MPIPMATTKRASSSRGKSGAMGMSLGAIIIAALLSILLFVSYVSRPDISVIKGVPVITQGLVVPAILIGVVVWALVEYSTPPGKGIWSLLGRFLVSFIIGGFVGGYLGYEFHFGAYVLTPSFAGNEYAEFFLAMSFLAVFTLIWTTAWAHTHGFKGIRTSGSKVLNFKESGPSKVKRVMVALFVIVAVMVLLVPAGAELGHLAAMPGETTQPSYYSLYDTTQLAAVREDNSTSSISQQTSCLYAYTSEFEMPTHEVKNATGVEHPVFYQTAYLTSKLTTGNINRYAISKIQITFTDPITANLTIGTGVAEKSVAGDVGSLCPDVSVSPYTTSTFVGTNATTFVPVEELHLNHTKYANFTLQPDMFLGNQSLSISYELQANVTTEITVAPFYTANPSSFTLFFPYYMVLAMYILGGILLLIFIPLSIPMIDMNASQVIGRAKRKNGGRR